PYFLIFYYYSAPPPHRSPLFPYTTLFRSHFSARLDDERTMRAFAESVDVLTFEFENVSSAALEAASEVGLVRPSPAALHTTQHRDRKSTRLNSSHVKISYAVFCLKKKNEE